MRLFWKIAAAILCVAVVGGAATAWHIYKAKTKLVEAAHACRVKAEQGDAKAEFDLGHMYYHGLGVPLDYAEALRWEHMSADQGYAKAEYGVGYMYFHGEGVPQDYTEALRWICKAADQGYVYAQGELGYMYETGKGVPQDYAEALRWYHKAADQGDALGESGIGCMLWYGYGVQPDRVEANRWFRKAADQGDEYAIRTLSKPIDGYEKFFLLIQLIGGIILLTSFLSLNIFESGKNLRSLRQRVISGTGVLMLFTTGLTWYGYTHYKIRCISCGINTFMVFKWLLNAIIIGLLFYVVLSKEPEAQESEITVGESVKGSENNKEL